MRYPGLLLLLLLLLSGNSLAADTFLVLCYHDVRDDVDGVVDDDQMAVSTDNLVAQFSWLREHGYHVISLDDVRAARQGKKSLPDKAVLLTFDDGYKSTYTHVFPLLKQFNYPAVVALVGSWLQVPAGGNVTYGSRDLRPRRFFMSWDEIKTMARSDLIEFASHTYAMHKGILGNPFGNRQPAATTLEYDQQHAQYESVARHKARIAADLRANNQLIEKMAGVRPRAMVWPYGAYSRLAEEVARSQGMDLSLTLEDGVNTVSRHDFSIKRVLIQGNPSLDDFVYLLHHPLPEDPVRAAHVDLDYIYDPDPVQQNKNLSILLDRIKAMRINTVYLQAFADPDGDGNADALYFPNRYLPVRSDLFNRVAWQLTTRCQVEVYAWMPVMSFVIPGTEFLRVRYQDKAGIKPVDKEYLRLSPFEDKAQTIIRHIYQDLAMHAHFHGILFHDDAYLSEDEDMSAAAITYMKKRLNQPDLSVHDLRTRYQAQWMREKTRKLTDFTLQLAAAVKYFRPHIKTARNMYANVILNPESQRWFSQEYRNMLDNYDYTAVMAMPYMEKASDPQQWLTKLIAKARQYDPGLKKTVFELQAIDWRHRKPVPSPVLQHQFRLLMRKGARHLAYYPDGFLTNQPALSMLRASISLRAFPYLN